MDFDDDLQEKIVTAAAQMVFERVFDKLTDEDWNRLRAALVNACVRQIGSTSSELLNHTYRNYSITERVTHDVIKHPEVVAAFEAVTAKLAPGLADRVREEADNIDRSLRRRIEDAFRR